MQPSKISYSFLGSFLATTFLLQWWQQASYPISIYIVIGLAGITTIFALGYKTKRKLAAYTLAALVGLTLAFLNVSRTTHTPIQNTIDTYATEQYVTLTGVIAAEPDRRPLQTKYTIAVDSVTDGSGSTLPVTGKTLVTDRSQYPEFEYGDKVTAKGMLEKPGQIETFHYDRYLSRFGIYSVIYRASLQKAADGNLGNPVFRFLFNLKSHFESSINKLYPEPHASFMAGLLTGSRRGIPEHLMNSFNATGLTHIIAISGYNITIIIAVITGMLFWLPVQWRLIPAILAIAAFTFFVGAQAAVIRAAIMGVLGILALHLGRQVNIRLALLWTLFFMLAFNPKYLWYDAGFQLSFLAVIGLIELSPLLERWFKWLPQALGIREAAQMTIAAQISAVPWIVYLFGRFSLIAPLANILVAPFIPLAMLFGFIGALLSIIWFPLGQVIAYLGWACLEWIVQVASIGAAIPLASINIPKIGFGIMVVYYVFLVGLLVWWNKKITQ